jgi:hypothetical protein
MADNKCCITIVKDLPTANSKQRIGHIKKVNRYGFGYGAQVLTKLKPGDKICFYVPSMKSVVLHGIVSSYPKPGKPPEEWSINDVDGIYDYYDTEIDLINVKEVEPPVNLRDARIKLGLSKNWGSYVMGTHSVPETEFNILIGVE